MCYKLRMSLLPLRRHRHRATRREWRRVAPPPHVAIHDADADQEQQQQQQLVTHTILLPQFGLCLVYMPHASCLMLRTTNFRQCPPHSLLELQLQLQIPPASNGCQTAARQGGLGQAEAEAEAEADAAWACTRLRSCTSPALLLVRLLQLCYLSPFLSPLSIHMCVPRHHGRRCKTKQRRCDENLPALPLLLPPRT